MSYPKILLFECNYILKINMRKVFELKLRTFCSCWINSDGVCMLRHIWGRVHSGLWSMVHWWWPNSSNERPRKVEREQIRTIVANLSNEHMQIEFSEKERFCWCCSSCFFYSKLKSYECSIQVICVQLIGFLLLQIFSSVLKLLNVDWPSQRMSYRKMKYRTKKNKLKQKRK